LGDKEEDPLIAGTAQRMGGESSSMDGERRAKVTREGKKKALTFGNERFFSRCDEEDPPLVKYCSPVAGGKGPTSRRVNAFAWRSALLFESPQKSVLFLLRGALRRKGPTRAARQKKGKRKACNRERVGATQPSSQEAQARFEKRVRSKGEKKKGVTPCGQGGGGVRDQKGKKRCVPFMGESKEG